MLYIIRQCDKDTARVRAAANGTTDTEPYTYTWHTGDKKPTMCGDEPFDDVCEVQADGTELAYIRRRFSNIPDCDDRVITWRGAMAQFIYDHLRHGC